MSTTETSTSVVPPDKAGRYPNSDPRKKRVHFAIGFVGWLVVDGIIFSMIFLTQRGSDGIGWVWLLSPLIVLGTLALLLLRRWIGIGALCAYGLNFALQLVFNSLYGFTNGLLGFPFWGNFLP